MITIDYASWGWPQWLMVAHVALSMWAGIYLHGETVRSNGCYKAVNLSLLVALLIFGGFFS